MTDARDELDRRLDRLGRSRFRAKFHLRPREVAYAEERGPGVIADHARDFIATRLAPAEPHHDGSQTPWGGHPVFRAQHATATCCRTCLEKNHGYASGRELTASEQAGIVDLLMRWITREMQAAPRPASTPIKRPCHEPSSPPLF